MVHSPVYWERRTGNLHGCADHLDTSIDQMLGNRLSPELARYRTPIQRLYLTGSGTHPGGGITGAPGRNTAYRILEDLGLLEPHRLRQIAVRAKRGRDIVVAAAALQRLMR